MKESAALNARVRQKEATRAAILQAALEEFSERGFDGASTRDIAAKASVHHALIKYHFNSKDELWRAAVTFLFERQASDLTLPGPDDPRYPDRRAYAAEIIRQVVLYSARHPEHARLMVQETCRDSERFHWAADTFIKRTSQAAGAFIRLLQRDGILPAASVPALTYIFVGASQLFYTLAPEVRRVWGIDPSDPDVIEDHVKALIAVMVR
ncbi:TetR/AcrR family transcriptional regulator [Caulobacter mirabilis]|uniref:TetR/AcrR family transcriptional regulator n=1 Tax=Caulobacter mirabilis TaxID=69666 RepID=UPI001FE86D38|nr:TetR/AcrR family transcriptional regulator [Caulobacter mirabilis]